jgi:glycosyltransferase involved in cell wall biosynthesis
MVYPTNGEGFGFIPFDAMATGMPTIVTNLTSCADFADLAIPLRATWGPGTGIHLGDWAIPDKDHLRELMLDVYENYAQHRKRAMQSARVMHESMTWDHVAQHVLDILGDKVYDRV